MTERVGLMSLWDQIAAFLRKDLNVVLPIAAAFFFLPTVILTRFMPATTIEGFTPSMVPPMLLILLLQTVGQLVIFILVLDDRKPTVAGAMRLALRRLLPAIGAQLMLFAMICGLLIVAQLLVLLLGGAALMRPGAAGTGATMQAAMLGIAIASPAILYVLARFSVAFPALVTDTSTPLEAMRRAFGLTRGNGWRIAALIVVAGLFYLFVQLALGTAFGGIAMLLGKLLGLEMLATLMILLFTAIIGMIATLIITVAIGYLYCDLARER